ncbi:MAG: HEPN domain-containing protein [bacterium]
MEEKKKNLKPSDEWFFQAEYDIASAEHMLSGGRYIYAVFMAHLALEKTLKGVYTFYLNVEPPRTHNLILLHERVEHKHNLGLNPDQNEVIEFLNEKSIPSRYPDVLIKILDEFKEEETTKLISDVKEIILCMKQQLKK